MPPRTKVIATPENSTLLPVAPDAHSPFCCAMNPVSMYSNTHAAFQGLTRQVQTYHTRLHCSWPLGVSKFLAHVTTLIEVVVAETGGPAHYINYYQVQAVDRAEKAAGNLEIYEFREVLGMFPGDLSVAGYELMNEKGLDYRCARKGHEKVRYLVNFWLKPENQEH